jgi:hypothetical protein
MKNGFKKHQSTPGAMVYNVNNRAGVKAVLESKEFREGKGIAVFRQSTAVVYVGIFVALLGLFALIPVKETFINIMLKAVLTIFFVAMGLRMILDGLISRVILESERIVYKSFCGVEKAIRWQDILKVRSRHVETDNGFYEYLLVIDKDTKIKISWCYIAYGPLRSEIQKRWKQSKA